MFRHTKPPELECPFIHGIALGLGSENPPPSRGRKGRHTKSHDWGQSISSTSQSRKLKIVQGGRYVATFTPVASGRCRLIWITNLRNKSRCGECAIGVMQHMGFKALPHEIPDEETILLEHQMQYPIAVADGEVAAVADEDSKAEAAEPKATEDIDRVPEPVAASAKSARSSSPSSSSSSSSSSKAD